MKIDMTEVNNQKETLTNSITSINSQFEGAKDTLANLASSRSLQGMVKSVIDAKINNYQIPLVTNFSNALSVLSAQYDNTITQFQSTVSENAADAIIDTDYLQQLLDAYPDIESNISSVDSETSNIYSSISDIISLTNPDASTITTPLSEGKTILTDTKTNMETFESWKRGNEYSDLISAQVRMLETLSTRSTSSFTSTDAKNFYSNMEFSNGVKVITDKISSSTPVEVLKNVSEALNALSVIQTKSWWKSFIIQQTAQRALVAGDIWIDDEGQLHCNGSAEAVQALCELEGEGEFELYGVKFSAEGKAFVGAKAVAEAKANITKDKIELSASAEAMLGVSASASAEIEKKFGVATLKAEYEAEVKAGAWANANAGLTIDENGLSAEAKAAAKAGAEATGSVEYSAILGDYNFTKIGVGASGEAFAGAKADASAEFKISPSGVMSASAKAGAYAGAEASGEVKGTIGYFSGSVGASAKAGVGGEAEAEFKVGDDHLKMKLDVGAALGVGAGLKVDVDFDYGAAVKDIKNFANSINPFK